MGLYGVNGSDRSTKVSGRQILKFLVDDGWKVVSQRGSHVRLQKYEKEVVVPMYPEVHEGLISYISAEIGMEKAEFLEKIR